MNLRLLFNDYRVSVIIFVLAVSAFFPLLVSPTAVYAASGTSCPSNDIFTQPVTGGPPNTLFYPGVHSASSANFADRQWLRAGPLTAVNGTVYTFDSVANVVTSNANFTQWTYHINPDRYWSNGQQITAQDWVNTYTSAFALNASIDSQDLRSEITSVVAMNSSAVVFNLNHTDSQFNVELDAPNESPPMPANFVAQGPSFNGFGITEVTDGPFYAVNYTAGATQAVMYRNPYFSPTPGICEYIFDWVNADSDVPPLLLGNSASYAIVDNSGASSLLGDANLKLITIPALSELTLSWDIELYPYNMTQFRQAIAYAINQNDIISEGFGGYGQVASASEGLTPPQSTWFDSTQTNYSYNPSQSLTLLHSIGFTGGANGAALKFPNGTSVSLTLWVANDQTGGVIAGTIVQQELSDIGITINTQVEAKSAMIGYSYANTFNIDHDMMIEVNEAQIPGIAYEDALPGWTEGYINFAAQPTWLPLGAPTNDYNGNLSAMKLTNNPTQLRQDLNNIQQLDSEYLPLIMLGWPDFVLAYNAAAFTISGNLSPSQASESQTVFAEIVPTTSSTASSSVSSTSSPTVTTSSASSIVTTTLPTTSSSSSSSIAINSSYLFVLATVALLLVGTTFGFVVTRRKRVKQT